MSSLDGETAGVNTEVDAEALTSEGVYWIDYRSISISAPAPCTQSQHSFPHAMEFLTFAFWG